MPSEDRKAFLLRIDPKLWAELEAWAGEQAPHLAHVDQIAEVREEILRTSEIAGAAIGQEVVSRRAPNRRRSCPRR